MKELRSDLPRLKLVTLCTALFSLAAHAYMYFTLAPSHDALYSFFADGTEEAFQLSLGRFMQPVYWLFRGRLPAPWLVGLLSILFLSGSVYLIVSVLDIRRRVSVALLSGVLAVNLTVTVANATYLPWADVYMFTLLLTCAGVWLWERSPSWGFLAAVPLLTAAMGFYQAYIDVAIGLALILLIRRAVEGEPFPALCRRAARYAVSLLAAAALYYLLMKISLRVAGVEMADMYNSPSRLLNGSPAALLGSVPGAYFTFVSFFFAPRLAHNTPAVLLCRGLILLAGLALWIDLLRRRHVRGLSLAVVFLCAALLPLGLNFVYVLSVGSTHELMCYSFFLVYPLALLPLEPWDGAGEPADVRRPWRLCRAALCLLCGCMVLHGVFFANESYLKKQVVYEASSQYAFSIVEAMDRTDGYEPGVTPVALIGQFEDSYLASELDELFPRQASAIGIDVPSSLTYPSTFASYCRCILGHPIELLRGEELSRFAAQDAVRALPVFPKEGFCQMIDGVMAVRLA